MKKHRKASPGDRILDAVIYFVLILLAAACLYPLYQVLVVSVSDPAVVMKKTA